MYFVHVKKTSVRTDFVEKTTDVPDTIVKRVSWTLIRTRMPYTAFCTFMYKRFKEAKSEHTEIRLL